MLAEKAHYVGGCPKAPTVRLYATKNELGSTGYYSGETRFYAAATLAGESRAPQLLARVYL